MRRFLVPLVLLCGCAPTSARRRQNGPAARHGLHRSTVRRPRLGRASEAWLTRRAGCAISADASAATSAARRHLRRAARGDNTRLTGFVDEKQTDSRLEVKRRAGRQPPITGTLDSESGTAVTSTCARTPSAATSGCARSTSAARATATSARSRSRPSPPPPTINGARELWALPPAAQAVVLPALLTCYGDDLEQNKRGELTVGFGGRQTWEGKHVSSIYHAQTGDVNRAIIQGQQNSTVSPK